MKDFENCSETVLIRRARRGDIQAFGVLRSEEHTSELQSPYESRMPSSA